MTPLRSAKGTFAQGHTLTAQEKNPNWKGESAGYTSKHDWVARHFGKPRQCEDCGTTSATRYEWANISGRYLRVRSDWKRLCKVCHIRMDGVNAKKPKRDGCSSRFKGVHWHKRRQCWLARIKKDRKQYQIGYFKDESEAALSYNVAAQLFHGPTAFLNPL